MTWSRGSNLWRSWGLQRACRSPQCAFPSISPLLFSRHAFGPNKCKQISMTSSRGSHAFTSSKLLPSLTTSFRRWCLCIFGDAISGSPCNEISTLTANYVRIISVHYVRHWWDKKVLTNWNKHKIIHISVWLISPKVQTILLDLICTKKRLTKPLIAVVHVPENK